MKVLLTIFTLFFTLSIFGQVQISSDSAGKCPELEFTVSETLNIIIDTKDNITYSGTIEKHTIHQESNCETTERSYYDLCVAYMQFDGAAFKHIHPKIINLKEIKYIHKKQ